jgi:23S rRNA (uracil1939-C5)-methyltransferase
LTSETIEVVLTAMTYGGDALGRLEDGRAVFVPFCLPGERVRIQIVEEREHFARGSLLEVLSPAPQRVGARCPHFGKCGGCHYQHVAYADQLVLKAGILRDQLVRIGRLQDPPVAPMVASDQPWNYRNQIQFHLTNEGKLGFVGTARETLVIKECHLPEASINALWPQLAISPDANVERVSLRAGTDAGLMLVLYSDTSTLPEIETEATLSVAHVCAEDVLVQAGDDHILLEVMGRDFRVSPTSFFQVNLSVAAMMIQEVLEYMPQSADTLVDAYCGVGLFSAFLASRCRRLIGIEASAAACDDFAANLDEFENVELYEGAVEDVLPGLDIRPEAVVVDPPRTGLERQALDAITRMAPRLLVYVSCDPATLARDAGRLVNGGYRLDAVIPFDMFPQTYHIESIAVFKR